MTFSTNGHLSLAKSPPQTTLIVQVYLKMLELQIRSTLAVKVDAKNIRMIMVMDLWLRVAMLEISKAIMSRRMSEVVPLILIKIIMVMAGNLLNNAQAPLRWTIITNASTLNLVMDSHIPNSRSSQCMTLSLRKRKRSPYSASNSKRPYVIGQWQVRPMHSNTWWASSSSLLRISSRSPFNITSSIRIRSSRIIRRSQGALLRSRLHNLPSINNIIISIRRVRR